MNKIKKELFETFEDLKDVTINGETFKSNGNIVTGKQLTEEETQRNRLEIEKIKQGTEEDKKLEIKIIGVD